MCARVYSNRALWFLLCLERVLVLVLARCSSKYPCTTVFVLLLLAVYTTLFVLVISPCGCMRVFLAFIRCYFSYNTRPRCSCLSRGLYWCCCCCCCLFAMPQLLGPTMSSDLTRRFHGQNERIGLRSLWTSVQFYSLVRHLLVMVMP